MTVEGFSVFAGASLFALMLPALHRAAVGPTGFDRVVAVNVIGTKAAVALVVIGTLFGRADMFVDFALTYALLNFVASLATARYLSRTRSSPEPKPKRRARGRKTKAEA